MTFLLSLDVSGLRFWIVALTCMCLLLDSRMRSSWLPQVRPPAFLPRISFAIRGISENRAETTPHHTTSTTNPPAQLTPRRRLSPLRATRHASTLTALRHSIPHQIHTPANPADPSPVSVCTIVQFHHDTALHLKHETSFHAPPVRQPIFPPPFVLIRNRGCTAKGYASAVAG